MNSRSLLALALAVGLVACGKPVPPEKAAFVGRWQGPGMDLLITQGGNVKYERRNGSLSKSIDGPLKGFHGDDFEVGLGPLSTTFVVKAPPHDDGGVMKMTVDGVELVRVAAQ